MAVSDKKFKFKRSSNSHSEWVLVWLHIRRLLILNLIYVHIFCFNNNQLINLVRSIVLPNDMQFRLNLRFNFE